MTSHARQPAGRDRLTHIFTYGTLMSSVDVPLGHTERTRIRQQCRFAGVASFRGVLLDVGVWPGAIPDTLAPGRVHGELWTLPADPTALLAMLDRYEGCAEDQSRPYSYQRRKMRVRLAAGRRVTAWVFIWIADSKSLPVIESGRWRPKLPVAAPDAVALDAAA